MNVKETELLKQILKIASRDFAQHGCNDVDDKLFTDWTIEEREKFVKEYHDYNGDPEEFDRGYLHLPDFAIMNYLAHKLANPVENRVMLTLADIKEEFSQWLVKISGDAGEYRIFGYDFFNERILVERSCGMEWVDLSKCKFISKGSA